MNVLQQRAQREAFRVDVHPARLDLGQVQDVVDELEQVRPGRMNDVGVLDLLGGEVPARVLSEEPGQDQQAVQRCAQLVRHVREELRLVFRGQRKLLRALLDLLPGLLDLGVFGLDVAVLAGELLGLVFQFGVGPLELVLLGLQFDRTGLQLGGQPLGLVQQRVGTGVGHDRVEVDAEGLGELSEEVGLHRGKWGERRQLDDAQHLVLE